MQKIGMMKNLCLPIRNIVRRLSLSLVFLFATNPLWAQVDNKGEANLLYFANERAIGQSYSRFQPEIRMVRVDSAREAYLYFLALNTDKKIKLVYCKGWKYYCVMQGSGQGNIIFTRRVKPNRNETAVLYITDPSLNDYGIREIHFVQSIKIRRSLK